MIKRTINPTLSPGEGKVPDWIDLEQDAEVEITSETSSHPIEGALSFSESGGWQADAAGEQTIRIFFPEPRPLKQARIVFEERECERTQQFVLRVAASPNGPWRELARQQFNFSPGGATREQEDYRIDLPAVATLEISIVPDISGGDARASLKELRLA
jgi:hypothetical protein